MVNLVLDNTWSLKSDFRQWILAKDDANMFYYTKLEDALQSYLDLKLRASNVTSIQNLIKHQRSLVRRLNQCINPLHIKFELLKIGDEK